MRLEEGQRFQGGQRRGECYEVGGSGDPNLEGNAQGGEEGFKEEGQWLLLVFMAGVISIMIGAVLFGALILRTMKACFSHRRSIKEKPIHDENEKEEIKEHTPKENPCSKGITGIREVGDFYQLYKVYDISS